MTSPQTPTQCISHRMRWQHENWWVLLLLWTTASGEQLNFQKVKFKYTTSYIIFILLIAIRELSLSKMKCRKIIIPSHPLHIRLVWICEMRKDGRTRTPSATFTIFAIEGSLGNHENLFAFIFLHLYYFLEHTWFSYRFNVIQNVEIKRHSNNSWTLFPSFWRFFLCCYISVFNFLRYHSLQLNVISSKRIEPSACAEDNNSIR